MPTISTSSETRSLYKDTLQKSIQVDFEVLNAALGIELNTQMSPLVIQAVIHRRLEDMSEDERNGLPVIVKEIILALEGSHQSNTFEKYVKPAKKKQPAAATAIPSDRMTITPVEGGIVVRMEGMPHSDLLRAFRSSKAWPSWAHYGNVEVSLCPEGVLFKAPMFTEFHPQDIRTVFRNKFGI